LLFLQVLEAIFLCQKQKGTRLSANVIPATEFFTAVVSKIKSLGSPNVKEAVLDYEESCEFNMEGEKVEIMQTVYNFIKDWDSSAIVTMTSVSQPICGSILTLMIILNKEYVPFALHYFHCNYIVFF